MSNILKKAFSLFLVFSLLLTCAPIAFAQTTPTDLILNVLKGPTPRTVVLSICVENAYDLAWGNISINYDPTLLAFDEAATTAYNGGTLTFPSPTEETANTNTANSTANDLIGDVNFDGKLTAEDARITLRAAAQLQFITEEQKKAGDMDGDVAITAIDARAILRLSAGLSMNHSGKIKAKYSEIDMVMGGQPETEKPFVSCAFAYLDYHSINESPVANYVFQMIGGCEANFQVTIQEWGGTTPNFPYPKITVNNTADLHNFGTGTTVVPATCAKAGTQKHTCTVCGKEETFPIPATGNHSYGEWKVTIPSTTTTEGKQTRTCTVCGNQETRTIAKLPAESITLTPAAKSTVIKLSDNTQAILLYEGMTAAQVLALTTTPGVLLRDIDGKALFGNTLVGSCATLTLFHNYNIADTYIIVLLGDTDGDGEITAIDARYALRASAMLEPPNAWQTAACDTDRKDGITAIDARLILRVSAKIDSFTKAE